jgi:hypothetical protein
MRRLSLKALPIILAVSACSRGRELPAGDSAVEGTDVGQGSPDRPTHDDGRGGNGDSDAAGGGSGDASASASGGNGSPADAAPCQGRVTFRIDAPDPSAWFVVDPFQDSPNWVSIQDAVGSAVEIRQLCTLASCGTCQFDVICGAAFMTLPVPVTLTWDGTMFPHGHCGADAKACLMEDTCAPPGHYDARMCASRNFNEPATCVDVPFDLPASGPVVGTLPQ